MVKFKVRNSLVNPFLVNPIKATKIGDSKSLGITHVYKTQKGLMCTIETPCGKWSNALLSQLEILNDHEAMRLEDLLLKNNLLFEELS